MPTMSLSQKKAAKNSFLQFVTATTRKILNLWRIPPSSSSSIAPASTVFIVYVPFGKYTNPQICDPATIRKDSELLQHVEILTGDFEETFNYAQGNTLFYFDPPYRPLSDTSSFNDYSKEAFNDDAQIRLKEYCDHIHDAGFHFMLSNSDCKGKNEEDNFFDVLYGAYQIERVWASRSINSNPNKRMYVAEEVVDYAVN